MRYFGFGIGRFTLALALASSLVGLQALGAGSLSVLPNVGASQVFNASQEFTIGAKGVQGVPHNQSGSLTVMRVAADSARFSASDGLDAFDQTLRVDARGTIAQSSPANIFVDALDTFAAALAAAPANMQKGVKWSVTVATPSWINPYTKGTLPKSMSSIPLNVKVVSVMADTAELVGVGSVSVLLTTDTAQMDTMSMVFECTLRSGQIKSCSRTTTLALNLKPNVPSGFGETTTLTAK